MYNKELPPGLIRCPISVCDSVGEFRALHFMNYPKLGLNLIQTRLLLRQCLALCANFGVVVDHTTTKYVYGHHQ